MKWYYLVLFVCIHLSFILNFSETTKMIFYYTKSDGIDGGGEDNS